MLIAMACLPLRAQNTEATVLGTVKDSSGAVVAGATVLLTNEGTSVQRTATTDGNGDYRFTGVQIGSYRLAYRGGRVSRRKSFLNSIC